jgi:soluble lytic murein transglycosylase-like protein
VIVRLIPLWVLILVILVIEPTLPFQAVGTAIRWTGNLFSGPTPTPVNEPVFIVQNPQETPTPGELPPPNWSLDISPIFTPEVHYWKEAIGRWSLAYRIKPNLIATLMQIESCGNPNAISQAGAKGLFQVMPENFVEGEDMLDPETNAMRGLKLFGQALAAANGDPGMALAAYNGGPSIFYSSPAEWPDETQYYQFWGSGIYDEAEMGLSESPTLIEWLDAGGSTLCEQAGTMLGISSPATP